MNELPDILKMSNNAFVNEFCHYCNEWFDACLDFIYVDKTERRKYYCYDCGEKIINRKEGKEKVILT